MPATASAPLSATHRCPGDPAGGTLLSASLESNHTRSAGWPPSMYSDPRPRTPPSRRRVTHVATRPQGHVDTTDQALLVTSRHHDPDSRDHRALSPNPNVARSTGVSIADIRAMYAGHELRVRVVESGAVFHSDTEYPPGFRATSWHRAHEGVRRPTTSGEGRRCFAGGPLPWTPSHDYGCRAWALCL
jgi:hypothetical protein